MKSGNLELRNSLSSDVHRRAVLSLKLGVGLAFVLGGLRLYDGVPVGEVHVPEHHVLDDAPSCLVSLEEFWALHAVQSPLPGLLCEQPVKWLRILSLQRLPTVWCSAAVRSFLPACALQHRLGSRRRPGALGSALVMSCQRLLAL